MNAAPAGPDPSDDFTRRIRELRRSMAGAGIDALVVLSPSNIEYLTGIDLVDFQPMETSQGIGKLVYIDRDQDEFVYYAVTSPGIMNTVTWMDHVVYDEPEDPASVVARRISGEVRALGIEGAFLPHNLSRRLDDALPSVELVDATRLVYEQRMVKSDEEVDRSRRSARIADLAMVDILPGIYGMREVDVASAAMESMLGHGAHNVAYSPIVSSGREVRWHHLRRHREEDRPGRLGHDRSGRQIQGLSLRLHPHFALRSGAGAAEEGQGGGCSRPEQRPWR